ncbi:olfactory receptor 5B21-like [Hyperolius riggenbachi]|uniref:olfactory receptor 5B21-like n=1 Tax=Hyperolius riggenbachi TaxID=752182 RepID=UPI0035A35D3C
MVHDMGWLWKKEAAKPPPIPPEPLSNLWTRGSSPSPVQEERRGTSEHRGPDMNSDNASSLLSDGGHQSTEGSLKRILRLPHFLGMYHNYSEHSHPAYFYIEGLSDIPDVRFTVFIAFLVIYLIIIFGNASIFTIISCNSHLHTPMYFFLMNLSVIDIVYTSSILPKILNILASRNTTIPFWGCIYQMYFFLAMACAEVLLLSAMAYDRYVAICHPLHYVILMSLRQAAGLATHAWAIGFIDLSGHAVLISKLNFCASNLIDHFFCDVIPLLKISCSDTSEVELINYLEGSLILSVAFMLTLISYIFIISTIIKIKSAEGRQKAFSTCSSHLTCVVIFYGTIICLYMRPTTSYNPKYDKFFALLYAILVPVLNPVIYSLKNHEIKSALLKYKMKLV